MEGHAEEQLTRRERQEARKKEREQARSQHQEQATKKKTTKSMLIWSLAGIVLLGIIYFVISLPATPDTPQQGPYTSGQVHWHATINVYVCGNQVLMPAPQGEHHLGLPLLHTHEDRLIHIEGQIMKPEDITLGRYMEVIGRNFRDDELLDKKNGDLCNDQPGKVKLLVNGQENSQLTNYVIKDGDKYELRFEP